MTEGFDAPFVIVGAGIGGLCAAIRLAAAGLPVEMFEKNDAVGGKMAQVFDRGYRWDTGPSVITMRHVLEETFAAAGRRLEDYLTLVPLEPFTRYFFSDGTRLDVTADWPRMASQIASLDRRDVQGYLAYLSYAAALHRITGPVFIYNEPPSWRSVLRLSPLDMIKAQPWVTMHESIRRRVVSPQLRQLLSRFATYVGSNPFEAPSVLGVIADVELTGGVWYPKGGIYRVAAALHQIAVEQGVRIHTGQEVSRILHDGRSVTGITLCDGTRVPARAVIANTDVNALHDRLLPRTSPSARAASRMDRRDLSCSGFVLMLGVVRSFPELAHHSLFFSSDYRREFEEIFHLGLPPSEPTIYVSITSKTDEVDAPSGHENWFVLVNAPPISEAYDWSVRRQEYRDRVLALLARRGFDVRGHIASVRMITPEDIAEQTGAWRGALYGISSNRVFSAFRRPHNRSDDLAGLYFVGGTTHPGGGVPMVMLSGKIASRMVLQDYS